jgi:uncharacterized delta-60 repeat protein
LSRFFSISSAFRPIVRLAELRQKRGRVSFDKSGVNGLPVVLERLEARRLFAGELDLTYGNQGEVRDTEGGSFAATDLRADDKLVGLKRIFDHSSFQTSSVLRYNTNGTRDNSFSGDGILAMPAWFRGADVISDSQNRIVLFGTDTATRESILVRLTAAGAFDNTFGTGGVVRWTDFGAGEGSAAVDLDVRDGTIAVLSGVAPSGGSFNRLLTRVFDEAGAAVAAFGNSGVARLDFQSVAPRELEIFSDGRILIGAGGRPTGDTTVDHDIFLARYHADGTLDASFGAAGIVWHGFDAGDGSFDILHDFKVAADGGVVVAASRSPSEKLVMRFAADGSVDESFGTGGVVMTPLEGFMQLTIAPDGKIVLPGWRLLPDGTPDPAFGTNGVIQTTDAGNIVEVQSDGKIIRIGSSYIVRYVLNPVETLKAWVTVNGGVLTIMGTNGADWMTVTPDPRGTALFLYGRNEREMVFIDGITTVIIDAGGGNDRVEFSPEEYDFIAGLEYIVRGGAGDDTIKGHDGPSTLDGGAGNDEIRGRHGGDLLIGGAGNDDIKGGRDNDTLLGGQGNDMLRAWGGRDRLSGGAGTDRLYGNNGDDVFKSSDFYSRDFLDGGVGIDTVLTPMDQRDWRKSIERLSRGIF